MFSETEEKFSKAYYNAPISMTISTIEEGIRERLGVRRTGKGGDLLLHPLK